MVRRSTMRFIFDELLENKEPSRTRLMQARNDLNNALSVASGFLDLLGDELGAGKTARAGGYLKEARRAVADAGAVASGLSGRGAGGGQNRPVELESMKSNVVSARKRL